jgi:hypothetical protein
VNYPLGIRQPEEKSLRGKPRGIRPDKIEMLPKLNHFLRRHSYRNRFIGWKIEALHDNTHGLLLKCDLIAELFKSFGKMFRRYLADR